jgi:autotransporter translocation and assembly factor TamB
MRMAKVGRTLSANAVNVFAPVGIPQMGTFTAHDGKLPLRINAAGMGAFHLDNFCRVHVE